MARGCRRGRGGWRQGGDAIEGRLILFDCDGTLVDSPGAIVTAIRRAFVDCGLAPPSEEDARGVIGLSLAAAAQRLAPSPALVPAIIEAYRRRWLELEPQVALYPGMARLLEALDRRGAWLGVVTGKSRRGLDRLLARLGIADRFLVSRTSDECPSKPHPAMVLECADELGVDPRAVIVVGDAVFDIEMARAAGARAIGVSWGCATPAALADAGAEVVVGDVEALRAYLDQCIRAAA